MLLVVVIILLLLLLFLLLLLQGGRLCGSPLSPPQTGEWPLPLPLPHVCFNRVSGGAIAWWEGGGERGYEAERRHGTGVGGGGGVFVFVHTIHLERG